MSNCRFPFLDCPGCDRCTRPVITLPPETEFLTTRFAMLCAIGGMCSIIALAAFTIPDNFNSVVSAHAEDVK